MFELIQRIPGLASADGFLIAPLAWIPRNAAHAVGLLLRPGSVVARRREVLFLLFPALLVVAAVWCTQLSHLHVAVPLGARAVHPHDDADVVGCRARRLAVLGGGCSGSWGGAGMGGDVQHFVAKLVLEVIRQIVLMPFTMTGRMTETYFRPGVPWVAFVMLVFWCVLEAPSSATRSCQR